MRPRGTYGEVANALLQAAQAAQRASVRQLAEQAQVGYAAARVTASRLISAGHLVVVQPGRPMIVAPPMPQPPHAALQQQLSSWRGAQVG